jgi:hypothetical protein
MRPITKKLLQAASLMAIMSGSIAFAQNYNPCSKPVQQNWCDASPAGSDITLLSVDLTPNPFVKGKDATVTITSVDSKTYDITKATFSFVLYFDDFTAPIITLNGNGCFLLGGCPLAPYSPRTSTFTFFVPRILPSGTYKGSLSLTDQNGNIIQAIQFDMPIH